MNFLHIIKRKRILFEKVKETDLILFDNNFANLTFKNIKCHSYNADKYYFNELLKSLLIYFKRFCSDRLTLIYFKILIEKLNPKVALSHEMNSNIFMEAVFGVLQMKIKSFFISWKK